MESVASMDESDRRIMSESVGSTPYLIDPVHLCGARRPRLFWPSWELVPGEGVTISSETGESWSTLQTVALEVEYDCTRFLLDGWEKVSNEPYPTFTTSRPSRTPGRGPAGLQQCGEDVLRDWASDLHRFPPYQYLHKFRLQDKHGNTRLLNCEEREVLMGFPRGYTVQCYPKQEQNTQAWQDERLTLVGNSWNVFVVAWLLTQLSLVLGIGPRLSLREVVEQCAPGGGRTLQSFLLRPFMRSPRKAINVLELRAVLTTLRWRIAKKGWLQERWLHLVDSLVCLHCLARGRSSSRKLRRTLLRINARLLASGTQGLWAYVHTAQNPADAPSRRPVRKKWLK